MYLKYIKKSKRNGFKKINRKLDDLSKLFFCISSIVSIVYFLFNILYKYYKKTNLSNLYGIPIEYFDADILYKIINIFIDLIIILLPLFLAYCIIVYSIHAIKKKYNVFWRVYVVFLASAVVYLIFITYYCIPWLINILYNFDFSIIIYIMFVIPFVLSILNVIIEIFFKYIISIFLLFAEILIVYMAFFVLFFSNSTYNKNVYRYEIAKNYDNKYIVASHYKDKLVLLNYSFSYIENKFNIYKGEYFIDSIENYDLIYYEFDINPKMVYRDSYFSVYNWQDDELDNVYLSTMSDVSR